MLHVKDQNYHKSICTTVSLWGLSLLVLHIKSVLSDAQSPYVLCISRFTKIELLSTLSLRLAFYSKNLLVVYDIANISPSVE